jgi:hypothetical protein
LSNPDRGTQAVVRVYDTRCTRAEVGARACPLARKRPLSSEFQARYLEALRGHLELGRSSSREGAERIGSEALESGLQPLGMAKIHDAVVTELAAGMRDARSRRRVEARAGKFFTTAVARLASAPATSIEAANERRRLRAALDASGTELADVRRKLAGEVERRRYRER